LLKRKKDLHMNKQQSYLIWYMSASVLMPLLVLALTAGGASPLETQIARLGPYQLLLSYYSLPRVGQSLNMTIGAANGAELQFSQATLVPAPGTDGNILRVQLTPDSDTPGLYDVAVTPPVRGNWYLHLTVSGSSGAVTGNIPMIVQGPPAMPTWLGWSIGLLPLPFLIAFIYMQIVARNRRKETVKRAV
jgi:uncharacterized membrane protein YhdT